MYLLFRGTFKFFDQSFYHLRTLGHVLLFNLKVHNWLCVDLILTLHVLKTYFGFISAIFCNRAITLILRTLFYLRALERFIFIILLKLIHYPDVEYIIQMYRWRYSVLTFGISYAISGS